MSDTVIGRPKSMLDTPCLVIDRRLLQTNINTMQHEVNHAKKNLRPHVKTHKCSRIAKMQIEAGAVGISAAKVSEALVLAQAGVKNTLITSPVITPAKIEKLMQCLLLDPELTVVVDNLENAGILDREARKVNKMLNVLMDIDPDVGRTGVAYSDAMEFAKALLKYPALKLNGIQCYAGNLQHISNYQERQQASTKVMNKAAHILRQLNEAGLECHILSGSGTGTYSIDLLIPEVTEVQPGSYAVMDAEYYSIGSSDNATHYTTYKPAMTLLSSIISTNHSSQVTCDAGWKALYQVPTKPIILQPKGLEYDWFGDEHGKITPVGRASLPKLGDCIELMAAHCDPTINMFDVFYVVEDGIVVDIWDIDMRGKSQ